MTDTRTENDALIEVAEKAARAEAGALEVQAGKTYIVPTATGPEVLDFDTADYAGRLATPRRKAGTVTVEDIDSFLQYWDKHSDDNSEVYVNLKDLTITAILDANTPAGPRWEEHWLVLQLRTTKAWKAWTNHDRKEMTQEQFANFVEDYLDSIVEPSSAEMLEIAQTFQAKTRVNFASAVPLSSGDRKITWEETTDASAGTKGQLQVPSRFKIAVAPIDLPLPVDGADDQGNPLPPAKTVYGIEARFRYRVQAAKLSIAYLLDDPEPILRDAVLAVVDQVESRLDGVKILRGTPAR